MTIFDREFSKKILTLIFVDNEILFSGSSNKEISLALGTIFFHFIRAPSRNLIIIRNTVIGTGLFMLIPLLVMIVLIMHGLIETEAIDIPGGAGGDDMRVVKRYNKFLHKVGQ